jgi:hypothetical protein
VILERDLGLEISRATLDGWVLKVGELLIPMVAAMRRELISGSYIQADETPVDVQTRAGRGKNHQAYLWQYSRPGGTVVFDFRLARKIHEFRNTESPFMVKSCCRRSFSPHKRLSFERAYDNTVCSLSGNLFASGGREV